MTLQPLAWVRGYSRRCEGDVPGTQTAFYRLSDLVNRELLPAGAGRGLLVDAGLVDLVWELTWADDTATPPSCTAGRAIMPSGRTSPAWW